jgi:hypothetical protein
MTHAWRSVAQVTYLELLLSLRLPASQLYVFGAPLLLLLLWGGASSTRHSL